MAQEWIDSHLVSDTLINPITPKGGLKVWVLNQGSLLRGRKGGHSQGIDSACCVRRKCSQFHGCQPLADIPSRSSIGCDIRQHPLAHSTICGSSKL
jgi:hypothetical protein